MHLTPIAHLENKYIRNMKRLNKQAFPKSERIPFDQLMDLSNSNNFDFLAIKNGETFIGHYLIAKNPDTVYIFFFAVTKKQRSKGYGRQILDAIKEYYPYQQIVLDMVEVDEDEPHAGQLKTKIGFYKQNGFHETGYDLSYAGMKFELLCSKKAFDKDSFLALLTEIKPIINTIKPETFEPELSVKLSEK